VPAAGKPEQPSPEVLAWTADAAARLAASLQARSLPRDRRAPARQALARAFDALENGVADAALARDLEALLDDPPPPFSLPPSPLLPHLALRARPLIRRRPFRSGITMRGALDPVLLERFEWRWALHDRIVARLQRVLDTFKSPVEPLERAEVRASKLSEAALELSLTRG
jgi:hypothetical protein